MLHPQPHDRHQGEPVIELKDVSAGYDSHRILEGINLRIMPGDFIGLLGPSGAGKTTLLRTILGATSVYEGQVLVHGAPLNGKRPRVGYVPQLETIDWNFPVTVEEAVMMGLTMQNPLFPWHRSRDKELAREMMDRLGIAHLFKRHIRELSGGQQQRVFLARALVSDPELLLLDEPTSGVDIKTRDEVMHLLHDLNHQGIAVVLTTHEINAVAVHLPWLVCVNPAPAGRGVAFPSNHAPGAERNLRRGNAGVGLPRYAAGGRKPPFPRQKRLGKWGWWVGRVVRDGIGAGVHAGIGAGVGTRTCLSRFSTSFFVRGMIAATLVGALCGLMGVYIVLRKMSYIGHGLSHAIFGGAVVSHVMSFNFFVGASVWGFLSALLITLTTRKRNIGSDAAIGIITTASFALGIALISRFKTFTRSFDAALFGNILGVTNGDLLAIVVVAAFTAIVLVVGYKLFLFATFDPDVAQFYGVPIGWVDTMFSLILAATIVVSMQVLGVTLIAAAIVIPPVVARLLTDNFKNMTLFSTGIGAFCGLGGIYVSFYVDVSSGASVVLFSALLFVLALAYNSLRGFWEHQAGCPA